MPLSYAAALLGQDSSPDSDMVRALQRDLRRLGYLARGIDGSFGDGTRLAVRRLQYDLMRNDGRSTSDDGGAPVAASDFNHGVAAVTGIVDPPTAASMAAMLADERWPKLPASSTPVAANATALKSIAALAATAAPVPFMVAIFRQESDSEHFAIPEGAHDSDSFVVLGLDTNDEIAPDHVTSRGYGLGQYTIFHHPPRKEEIADFVLDPVQNVRKAFGELRDKFDHFVVGHTSATQADDRAAEHPLLTLRLCRYQPSDARYMRNCRACALDTGKRDITPATPLYHGGCRDLWAILGLWTPQLWRRARPGGFPLRLALRNPALQRQRPEFLPLPGDRAEQSAGRRFSRHGNQAMNLGTVLDVALGLSLTFFTLSLIASALQEMIAGVFTWRGTYLSKGIDVILDNSRTANFAWVDFRDFIRAHLSPHPGKTAADMLDAKLASKEVPDTPENQTLKRVLDVHTHPLMRSTPSNLPSYVPGAELRPRHAGGAAGRIEGAGLQPGRTHDRRAARRRSEEDPGGLPAGCRG